MISQAPKAQRFLCYKNFRFLYLLLISCWPTTYNTHNNSRLIALAAAKLFNYFLLLGLGTILLLPLPKVCLKQLSLPISTAITTYNNGLMDPTCGL